MVRLAPDEGARGRIGSRKEWRMALLRWRENMSVGVESVDADHKHLVDLLNRLHFLVLAGGDRTSVGDVLDHLLQYVGYHFDREEKLMAAGNYPGLEEHQACHRELARQLLEHKKTFDDRPESFDATAFYDFVSDWLLVHVMDKDMKYKPYVAADAGS
jgi:hemerythrin